MKSPIKTNLIEKLRDLDYRYRFFRGRSQDEIAHQIKDLSEKRGLRQQSELAELCEMKQSAISRLEKSNYSRWNFNTLWRIARALDARVRVIIEPMEDVLEQYREREAEAAGLGFPKFSSKSLETRASRRTTKRSVDPTVANSFAMVGQVRNPASQAQQRYTPTPFPLSK